MTAFFIRQVNGYRVNSEGFKAQDEQDAVYVVSFFNKKGLAFLSH